MLKDEQIVDIRKIYKSGVTDSVLDSYRSYLKQWDNMERAGVNLWNWQRRLKNYTLAVNRRYKRDGEQEADFISCITFGKSAEFAQKYLHKGMRIVIGGRISTGSYKDKDGKTIYTTDVIVEEREFAQNKDSGAGVDSSETSKTDKDGFMEASEGEIPFN